MGIMGWKTKIENSPAQQDSKFSNGRLSDLFCWPQEQDENCPAPRHSKFSKLFFWCSIRPSRTVAFRTCHLRAMATTTKAFFENCPAQRHSKFSKLVWFVKNSPAQQHSKMTNGRLSGLFCWPQRQDENSPVQWHSKFSKWINCPLSPLCLFSPLAPKNRPAQRHSRIYKLGMCLMELIGHIGLIGITPAVE